MFKFYEVSDEKLVRKKRDCPRCGKGVFMAEHSDRNSCGKCGFTEFVHKTKAKKS
ncbi:MAG: 30S ribosomal protein S27ae [Thermoproteota archaeon]|nr:30S ribosomal protein S27ae [Thermoproteota archaeon]